MKRTCILSCFLALLLIFARESAAFAQDGPPGPPPGGMWGGLSINVKKFNAEKELARLTKKYKLTEAQKGKIQPILADQQARIFKLGEDESLSDQAWVEGVRKAHQETVAKVKEQMTDDQATRYLADEKKQAKSDAEDDAGMDGPPGGPPPGPPPGGGGPM